MEIKLARNAGFCFGVDKAVKTAFEAKSEGKILTLGELIHNTQVTETLEKKGVHSTEELSDLQAGDTVIIRAHGVGEATYEKLKEKQVEIIDATCPYVKRIHEIVSRRREEGYTIIIVGDANHPEVRGINGWCGGKAVIVSNIAEAEALEIAGEKLCTVSQTTFKPQKYHEIYEAIKKKFAFVIKFDTICNATIERQSEAYELSKSVDAMVVIGGKNSSNTQKLYEICKENCPSTFLIENANELPDFGKHINTVGITAGASTPEWVIKEVIFQMEDTMNRLDGEIDFSKALEESFTEIKSNEIVKGKIIGYNTKDVFVDLSYKADGIIPMDEFIDDPQFDPERDLKPGTVIEALIIKINDGEGNVVLSKKKIDAIRGFEFVEEAFKNGNPISAVIKEAVKGGVVADYKGVRIFIPASQLSDRFIKDLTPFVGKTVTLLITEMANRRRVVGSCRTLIEEEKAKKSESFWNEIEMGKEYTGVVKSLTKFGVFVDLGAVDGLIHISELSWKKIEDPAEVIKVGDTVTVRVTGFDKEKKKVSLGYRKAEDNPWYSIDNKYEVGQTVKGVIMRMVPFGAFVELEEGVEGLVHISQISSVRIGRPDEVLSVGQPVEMKVIEVNPELKKISLSIKEVKPIDPVREGDVVEADGEAVPSKHVEDMPNTIGDIFTEKK